jgi:hypothetical protein
VPPILWQQRRSNGEHPGSGPRLMEAFATGHSLIAVVDASLAKRVGT